jgi:sulfite oxidase
VAEVPAPGKRPDLIVHQLEPFNAETPAALLADPPLTPADAFYVRNHGRVPAAPAGALRVDGLVERALELTVAQLRARFPPREVVATLVCAGNRRADLHAARPVPDEIAWGPGAAGTARWRGAALADVLAAAGVRDGAAHVELVGGDRSEEAEPPQRFGGSIPLHKALAAEVLLAWEMNGAPLAPLHGAPLRAVVPGYAGARSVKWLERVTAAAEPSANHFQARAYRLLPATGEGDGVPLGELPVTAAILAPADGAAVAPGPVEVRGYAFSGGGRPIARVEVSADGGARWVAAELGADLGRWAWRPWLARVTVGPDGAEIAARAWDAAAQLQPEDPLSVWNPKGYVSQAWPRVRVRPAR